MTYAAAAAAAATVAPNSNLSTKNGKFSTTEILHYTSNNAIILNMIDVVCCEFVLM